jgi:hypothetical protein
MESMSPKRKSTKSAAGTKRKSGVQAQMGQLFADIKDSCRLSEEDRTRLLTLVRRNDGGASLLDEVDRLVYVSRLVGIHEGSIILQASGITICAAVTSTLEMLGYRRTP